MTIQTKKEAVLTEVLGDIQKIEDAINGIESSLNLHKATIEEINDKWSDDLLERTARIINAAVVANKAAIQNQIVLSMDHEVIRLTNLLKEKEVKKDRTLFALKLVALINIVATISIVVASFLFIH